MYSWNKIPENAQLFFHIFLTFNKPFNYRKTRFYRKWSKGCSKVKIKESNFARILSIPPGPSFYRAGTFSHTEVEIILRFHENVSRVSARANGRGVNGTSGVKVTRPWLRNGYRSLENRFRAEFIKIVAQGRTFSRVLPICSATR